MCHPSTKCHGNRLNQFNVTLPTNTDENTASLAKVRKSLKSEATGWLISVSTFYATKTLDSTTLYINSIHGVQYILYMKLTWLHHIVSADSKGWAMSARKPRLWHWTKWLIDNKGPKCVRKTSPIDTRQVGSLDSCQIVILYHLQPQPKFRSIRPGYVFSVFNCPVLKFKYI